MTQLSGKDLDIAVGLANGWTIRPEDDQSFERWIIPNGHEGMLVSVYKPSTLWMHGGPLIDAHAIDLSAGGSDWWATANSRYEARGETALEAICRAYVMMKGQQ